MYRASGEAQLFHNLKSPTSDLIWPAMYRNKVYFPGRRILGTHTDDPPVRRRKETGNPTAGETKRLYQEGPSLKKAERNLAWGDIPVRSDGEKCVGAADPK